MNVLLAASILAAMGYWVFWTSSASLWLELVLA
jgi:hypothetical protein